MKSEVAVLAGALRLRPARPEPAPSFDLRSVGLGARLARARCLDSPAPQTHGRTGEGVQSDDTMRSSNYAECQPEGSHDRQGVLRLRIAALRHNSWVARA